MLWDYLFLLIAEVLSVYGDCRGTTTRSLCDLTRSYLSLWTAAVQPVAVNYRDTTSLCKLPWYYQSISYLPTCRPIMNWGAPTRGADIDWLAGLPDSLHVGNQSKWTAAVLYVSINCGGAISLCVLPRGYQGYLSLLTAVVLSVSVNCRGTTVRPPPYFAIPPISRFLGPNFSSQNLRNRGVWL